MSDNKPQLGKLIEETDALPVAFSLLSLPERYHEAAKAYLTHGVKPEGLLQACLENDLLEVFINANYSKCWAEGVLDICWWLHWHCPAGARGSEDKVIFWMRERRLKPYKNVKWITK